MKDRRDLSEGKSQRAGSSLREERRLSVDARARKVVRHAHEHGQFLLLEQSIDGHVQLDAPLVAQSGRRIERVRIEIAGCAARGGESTAMEKTDGTVSPGRRESPSARTAYVLQPKATKDCKNNFSRDLKPSLDFFVNFSQSSAKPTAKAPKGKPQIPVMEPRPTGPSHMRNPIQASGKTTPPIVGVPLLRSTWLGSP